MGNNKAKKRHKFHLLLEKNYKVNLFYKPTMQNEDVYYYAELDNKVMLVFRIMNENVISILNIIPITHAYINSFYEELLLFFTKQDQFTIIMSSMNSITSISSTCTKLNIPIVDDATFIPVPKRLYQYIKNIHNDDLTMYGAYILAVNESPDIVEESSHEIVNTDVKEPEIVKKLDPEPINKSPIDLFIDFLIDKGYSKFTKEDGKQSGHYTISIHSADMILDVLQHIDDKLTITIVNCNAPSLIVNGYELLRVLTTYSHCDLYIMSTNNRSIETIIKAYDLPCVNNTYTLSESNSGKIYKIN